MVSKNTILTILTKFGILLANFVLVVFSTRTWGSAGRGEIALVLSNVSIIAIFGNVFCGSTVAYHASRIDRKQLFFISFSGGALISFAGSFLFSLIFGIKFLLPLFLISLFLSLTTSLSSWWMGKNNIMMYNLLTLLGPVLILSALMILYFFLDKTGVNIYYTAYCIGLGILFVTGILTLQNGRLDNFFRISFEKFKDIAGYGTMNELSYLLQFLNYRLSYYFIAAIISIPKLGIFSIVVSISEAVWVISRSMSAVHFSNVVNSDDMLKNRRETVMFAWQSFAISLIIIVAGVLMPDRIYQLVFGRDFTGIRKYLILMMPGMIAIAVSNLFGHYFAGTGRLKVLRDKSLLGLAASLILLPLLVKKYELTGACISLDVSYIISSVYLWISFRRDRKSINFNT